MEISREFKDGRFPTSRRDQFLSILVNLFVLLKLGFEVNMAWIPVALGLLCMATTFVMSLASRKVGLVLFNRVWWSGIGLSLLGVTIGTYTALQAVSQ